MVCPGDNDKDGDGEDSTDVEGDDTWNCMPSRSQVAEWPAFLARLADEDEREQVAAWRRERRP